MTDKEIEYLREKARNKTLMRDNQLLQKLIRLANAGIPQWKSLLVEITPGIVG